MGNSFINRDIIDNMPCCVYWKASDATYGGCNMFYAKKMGIDPGDIIGRTDSELEQISSGGFVTDSALADICAVSDGNVASTVFSIGDGADEKWFSAKRISVDSEDDITVLGVVHEITREFKPHTENEKIQDIEKSDFLSRVSHELCTPLNAIINMSHFAKSEDDAAKVKSNVSIIHKASTQLLDTVNDILDMSRIEMGQVDLVRLPFELEKMLVETCSAYTSGLTEKELTVGVNVERNTPRMFRGDEFRLSQIITNLLKITARMTPEHGRIDIDAEASGIIDNKAMLEFRIKSTGTGSSRDSKTYFNSIVEQLISAESKHYGEAGLEITVCKGIIGLMGGEIRAEYIDGGETFNFAIQMEVFEFDKKLSVCDDVKIKGQMILHVTREEGSRSSFQELMDEYGIKSVCAEDGENALRIIEEAKADGNSFSIAFIDHHLPEIDGVETAKRIRKANEACAVIILISIQEWKLVKAEAISAGFNDFLSKPPAAPHIIDVINRITTPPAESDKYLPKFDQKEYATERACTGGTGNEEKERSGRAAQVEKYRRYIDIEKGLSRFGGNKRLFANMLKSFIDGVAFSDLKKSVTESNLQKIQQDYTMLIGVVMNLSLTKLYKGLALSESQLKSRQYQIKALSEVEKIVQETNQKVSELLAEWELEG